MIIRIQLVFYLAVVASLKMEESLARRPSKKEELRLTFGKEVGALLQGQADLMKELSQLRQDLKLMKRASLSHFPLDCNSAKMRGDWRSVTLIAPPGLEEREVRCDQVTAGGGWTVVLRRSSKYASPIFDSNNRIKLRQVRKDGNLLAVAIDQHENFNRTWIDYKRGFGNPADEYWIGNEVIHALTKDAAWEAAVLLRKWDGREASAFWDSFRVGGEEDKFRMHISGYRSDRSSIGDGLTYHNGRSFSTEDADNDENKVHCAKKYGGGWWFHQCHVVHLTGSHLEPGSEGEHAVHWLPWTKDKESLKSAVLMIRPKM